MAKTKKISLYYLITKQEVKPPPTVALERKEAWLNTIQALLKTKETKMIRVTYELFNPEIQQMQRFFNGAVIEYYAIQNEDMLIGRPTRLMIDMYRETILDDVLGYDVKLIDRITRRRKSTADFWSTQEWNDFLATLYETHFEPQGYEFPNSEEYWRIAEKAGEEQTRTIVIKQLQDRLRRKLSTV